MPNTTSVIQETDNLVELLQQSVDKNESRLVFGTKNNAGEYDWITYGDFSRRVDNLRSGLAGLGVNPKDTVSLIGSNSVEWAVVAYATYGRAARFVPMYEAELPATWQYIIHDSGAKVLFVANEQIYEKVQSFKVAIPGLEHIFVIKGNQKDSMAQLELKGASQKVEPIFPEPSDIAGLIYTSGTTGDPKGVLLSHRNLTSNAYAGRHEFPELDHDCRCLSILPWAHSYAQTAELNTFLQFGGSIAFAESVDTVADDLQNARPTHLVAVPRLFNKIYAGLWAKMEEQGGLAKKLFVMGVSSAKLRRELAEEGRSSFLANLKYKIADKIVFEKIRQRFGGRLKFALTASATMNPEISHFFFDLGIPLYDCYGLTETSPALTVSSHNSFKAGSVGKVVRHSKIVIDKSLGDPAIGDGEIIAYGPNVMQGYHNKPEATAAVMTDDGGFRTGDLGRIDEDGFLYITGRIKEQYKLENGKYCFPAQIEEEIKLLPSVANAFIYGEGKAYNVCIIVPDFAMLERFTKASHMPDSPMELIEHEAFKTYVRDEITQFLKGKFGGYEIPKKFIFVAEDFTIENGMLTQTMKLKRRIVLKKYQDMLDALYTG